jgi:hypothetical protein
MASEQVPKPLSGETPRATRAHDRRGRGRAGRFALAAAGMVLVSAAVGAGAGQIIGPRGALQQEVLGGTGTPAASAAPPLTPTPSATPP